MTTKLKNVPHGVVVKSLWEKNKVMTMDLYDHQPWSLRCAVGEYTRISTLGEWIGWTSNRTKLYRDPMDPDLSVHESIAKRAAKLSEETAKWTRANTEERRGS